MNRGKFGAYGGEGYWGRIRCQFLSQHIISEPPTKPRTLKKVCVVVGGGGGLK